ncbi:MAG: hypothetical protein JWP11_1327 [Frankiales bacterium]|nr:hypothetical protein [Frankiales bacterium]
MADRKSFAEIRAEQEAKREAKREAKAATPDAQAKAEQAETKVADAQTKILAAREAARAATPVGQAEAAHARGQGFFEVQLEVATSQRDVTIAGSTDKSRTSSHAGTLSSIEAVGWRLEHVGYVFQVTGESSRDKFVASGQQVAVSGKTVGIYLFRRLGA